jgi:peptidoglycan/xylan/chitin deacetylase (PgdA/CDA1 family)
MRRSSADKKVIALFYHSVTDNHTWPLRQLSTPIRVFESHLQWLRRNGYRTLTATEYLRAVREGEKLPERSVLLTFDDGYLDNWVNAFPLLMKYDCKATIFVSPEFADPAETPRPNLEDVWAGGTKPEELVELGFLSWVEMRAMVESGRIDIQSHTMSHTWQFTSDRIVDVHHPGDDWKYPWLLWNLDPERKHQWPRITESERFPYGYPVFENARAMVARRYVPDEGYVRKVVDTVAQRGGEAFFRRDGWRTELFRALDALGTPGGRYETEEERRDRLVYELRESKQAIERELRTPCEVICWPGGAYDRHTVEIAERAGYRAMTVRLGADPTGERMIPLERVGSPSVRKVDPNGRIRAKHLGSRYLAYQLGCIEGDRWSCAMGKLLRVPYRAGILRI